LRLINYENEAIKDIRNAKNKYYSGRSPSGWASFFRYHCWGWKSGTI